MKLPAVLVLLLALPAQVSAEPIPLRFPAGSYGVMVSGKLTLDKTNSEYSFDSVAGRRVIISFGGAGPLKGGVSCDGVRDGPYDGSGNTFIVPSDGRCIVQLWQNRMERHWTGGFTLSVLVVKPH